MHLAVNQHGGQPLTAPKLIIPHWIRTLAQRYAYSAIPTLSAEDIVAEVLAKLLRRNPPPQSLQQMLDSPFTKQQVTWALIDTMREQRRRHGREVPTCPEHLCNRLIDQSPTPEDLVAPRRMQKALREKPPCRSESHWNLMVAKLIGQSDRATAATLGKSPATVNRRWQTLRQELWRELMP